MDRMIYLSMAGAKATMQRQDTLAHNLANASTTGFRAELQAFRAVPVVGEGASTRVFALESTPGYNAAPGPVQGLDGTEPYTRAGNLDLNTEGQLTTSSGLTVLGDGGPITIPANSELK